MNIIDKFRLDGLIALVTGASGKLGSVWTKTLLEAGAKVAALDLPLVPVPAYQEKLQNNFGVENLKFFAAIYSKPTLQAYWLRNKLGSHLGIFLIARNDCASRLTCLDLLFS